LFRLLRNNPHTEETYGAKQLPASVKQLEKEKG
jgi:hypothetical protein